MAKSVVRGKALVAKLRAQAGVRDAEALAAWIGRYKKLRKMGKPVQEAQSLAGKVGGMAEARGGDSSAGGGSGRDRMQKDKAFAESERARGYAAPAEREAAKRRGQRDKTSSVGPARASYSDLRGKKPIKDWPREHQVLGPSLLPQAEAPKARGRRDYEQARKWEELSAYVEGLRGGRDLNTYLTDDNAERVRREGARLGLPGFSKQEMAEGTRRSRKSTVTNRGRATIRAREDELHKEYLAGGRGSGPRGEFTMADQTPLRRGMDVQVTREGAAAKAKVIAVKPNGEVEIQMRDGTKRRVHRSELLVLLTDATRKNA